MSQEPRRVLIAGSSGLIGRALVSSLQRDGIAVRTLVRGAGHRGGDGVESVAWDPGAGALPSAALGGVDAVVNLGGAPVGTRRWTRSYRDEILRSRVAGTSLLAHAIANRTAPPVLVQASAVGFYGDRGTEVLTEASSGSGTFLAGVVRRWEHATGPAGAAGARVMFLRTGIVLSPDGGAVTPMLKLLRLGLGGPLGGGRQIWSWITLVDHVRAIRHLMRSEVSGPVNLTAPAPATNLAVTRALGREFNRPVWLPAPAPALRVALGGFAGEVLASQDVRPRVLERDGFDFEHPDITTAARWVRQHSRR